MKFLLSFTELFIIKKYVKIRFKNRRSSCCFLSSIGQNTQNIAKVKLKRLFWFTFFVSFFMAFLAQKLISTIMTFRAQLIFEQDHPLVIKLNYFKSLYVKMT